MFETFSRAAYLLFRYRLVGFPRRKFSREEYKRREAWLIGFENYEARIRQIARAQGVADDPAFAE